MLPPRDVVFPEVSSWNALLEGFRDTGHLVSGFGALVSQADAIVAMNDQPETRRLQETLEISPERSALILLEPRVTSPSMYRDSILARYAHRFAASPQWAQMVGGISFPWPQDLTPRVAPSSVSPTFAATMVNAEKRSAVPGSLYGLRRSVIEVFDGAGLGLAVAGPGWHDTATRRARQGARAIAKALNAGMRPDVREAMSSPGIRPRHWLGRVDDKALALAHSTVTLVIENSPDYVSEKLIDAIVHGVVPVYVGPPLEPFGIPSDLAVTPEPRAEDVLRAVADLSPTRATETLERGKAWLASPDAASHEIRRVLRELGRAIGQQLDGCPSARIVQERG